MSHDVIIVGARCAGASLAALLARRGLQVLVLEGGDLGTDMPMSTHFMQPPCMDVLDDIGLGEKVRACTPASRVGRYRMGTHDVYGPFPEGRPGYCIRRSTIDPMLQEAAREAGAELRDRHRVVDLLKDRERVTGVVVETPVGREQLRARLVVGADGRKSTVARLAGVEEYLTFPMPRAPHWFYIETPKIWSEDERFAGWDGGVLWEGQDLRYVFQCDGDTMILAAAPPLALGKSWGKDATQKTIEYLRGSEVTRPLMDAGKPLGKTVGLVKANFFYRRPVGPGFALVGDAGNFKDYVTGHGMADAFLSARRMSKAILLDTETAYERYWRERDVETLPLYFDAIRMGEVEFNDPFTRELFAVVKGSEELSTRFGEVANRTLHPFEAFSMKEMMSVLLHGLLRGRFGALGAFMATGKRMQGFTEELRRRKDLLDACPRLEDTAKAHPAAA